MAKLSEQHVRELRKNSRNAAIGTAIGALIVLAAMAYSVFRLGSLQEEVQEKQQLLSQQTEQIEEQEKQLAVQKERIVEQDAAIATQADRMDTLVTNVGVKQDELERLQVAIQKAEVQLLQVRSELQDVQNWGSLFQLAALGGQVATAENYEEATRAFATITDVEKSLGNARTQELSAAIDGLRELLKTWSDTPNRPANDQVHNAVIELGQASRAAFASAPPVLAGFATELERVLYDQAVSVARRLTLTPPNTWNSEASQLDRRDFWRLYYGDLVFIESPEVAWAMFELGRTLRNTEGNTEGKPDDLAKGVTRLEQAATESLQREPL